MRDGFWRQFTFPPFSGNIFDEAEHTAFKSGYEDEPYKHIVDMDISSQVLSELVRLGNNLASYTRGQIEAAEQGYKLDGRLIDDPNGTTFEDQLELTEEEIELEFTYPFSNQKFQNCLLREKRESPLSYKSVIC